VTADGVGGRLRRSRCRATNTRDAIIAAASPPGRNLATVNLNALNEQDADVRLSTCGVKGYLRCLAVGKVNLFTTLEALPLAVYQFHRRALAPFRKSGRLLTGSR
jgi:hypothetical protein